MGVTKPETPKQIPLSIKVLAGAVSGCMATTIVQPADLLKTRMQLFSKECKGMTMFDLARKIIQRKGITGLYRGFSAALARQFLYSGGRLGIFNEVMDRYQAQHGGKLPNLGKKVLIGMMAGVGGAVVSMPPEVALIRMTADGRLPPEKRRNYKHVLDAMFRMAREEGVGSLLKGFWPTMTRSMLLNGAQLASYSEAREALVKSLGTGMKNHFVSSMISGFVTTIVSQPVDTIKTRIQNSKNPTTQFAVLKRIVQKNGVLGLWAGFIPNYIKIGPHTVMNFMFLEQINSLYLKYA